jgi:hypothetical protein
MTRTLRTSIGLAAAAVAAVGLVGSGAGAAVSAPHAHASIASTPQFKIVASKKHFKVSGPKTFQAGRVAVSLRSKGIEGEVEFVSFKQGYSFPKLKRDLVAFFSSEGPNGPSKAGLRALNRAVKKTTLYGGLDVAPGTTLSGTVVLPKAGTYYLYNDSGVPADPRKLKVTGPAAHRASPHPTATVKAVTGKRFRGATKLPAKGTITFKNAATDSPHFLNLQHVKNGTTRKQVLKFLRSGAQGNPSFGLRGGANTDVVGEGRAMTLSYSLPKGEYVEMCFFPDLQTGMPHALMGMVRVVHLK